MFVEEEWNDTPLPDGSSHTDTVTVSSASSKKKAVGKKSLLRTLQTLGSVPEWNSGKVCEDSDEENYASAPCKKIKRKSTRCKKRKRASNTKTEGETIEEVDPETPLKKQKIKQVKTAKDISREDVSGGVDSHPEKHQDQTDNKLTRQQWRNKMKNKKRVTNKFLPKMTNAETDSKEETLAQTQGVEKTKKCQNLVKSFEKAEMSENNGDKLTRQQWRNKMKNKKKLTKKCLPKPTNVEINSMKDTPAQSQSDKNSKDLQKPDVRSEKSKMQEEKEDFVIKNKTENLVDAKTDQSLNTKTKKVPRVVKKFKVLQNHDTSSETTKRCEINGISSVEDKADDCKDLIQEPSSGSDMRERDNTLRNPDLLHNNVKGDLSKKSKLQAEKLRHILNTHHVNINTKPSDQPKDIQNNPKTEEEQAPLDASTALRMKMEKRLEAARFRFINEKLYTSTSAEAKRMFQQEPDAIAVYHKGYTTQVQHWPANPVDAIISYIDQKSASLVVADFGCGDCKIAQSVKNKVHCFDLAPVCKLATACDMAKVPLADSSVDIVVFCLSLMGTNLAEFLAEANRVLVMGGVLKIVEVASRFENVHSFIRTLSNLGFKNVSKDTENSYFYSFEFIKIKKSPGCVKKIGLQLKPCLYKKR